MNAVARVAVGVLIGLGFVLWAVNQVALAAACFIFVFLALWRPS